MIQLVILSKHLCAIEIANKGIKLIEILESLFLVIIIIVNFLKVYGLDLVNAGDEIITSWIYYKGQIKQYIILLLCLHNIATQLQKPFFDIRLDGVPVLIEVIWVD